ncbi:MAG: VTT domain-containing protein [Ardenticatenaceae bacterium]|nr:VTT domain-containing protein [Ardenticatenaceae bacterium]
MDALNKWYDVSDRKGLLFFMFAFMVPIFPADVLNYVAGLSSLSARRFFVTNLVGRLPGVLLMTAIGAYGFHLSLDVWLVIATAGLLLAGSWWLLFGRKR